MLLQLNIKNFALIENLSINFEKGFNILSGETGAGKSILIDAINYVLGSKFNKDLIRSGENNTFVEAVFTIENKKTEDILKNQEIEYEDMVIISRQTFQSGKTIAKVNGNSLLLAKLKLVSETLIDIHGQHENQNLLNSFNHIIYLDYFGENKIKKLLKEYKINYNNLVQINNKINELIGNEGEKEKLVDFLKYQIEEISEANLKINETEELEEKYKILSNSEKINNILNTSYENLYNGNENTSSIQDNLGKIIKDLESINNTSSKVEHIIEFLRNAYYNIEEGINEIRDIKDSVYFDPKELEYINSRIFKIDGLKKKYGKTIKDVLNYKNKIEIEYEEIINSKDIVEKLKSKKYKIMEQLKKQGIYIHKVRCMISEHLEEKIKKELNYVGLEKSTLKIKVDLEEKLNSKGLDKVEFYISTNPGQPLKPLEKIVSGGELSRIMLALKTVFVDKDKIPTVIFDEIDTGISGRIAQRVAEKMYQVSNKHQVLCVTHLPQIACMSDVHYLVSKEIKNKNTYTKIQKLTKNQKEYEIAKMIGGSDVTKLTIEHSKEMIYMANMKK